MIPAPEQRTRKDLAATAATAATALAAGVGIWAFSDARAVDHHPNLAAAHPRPESAAPAQVHQVWDSVDEAKDLTVSRDGVLTREGEHLHMKGAGEGEELWSYVRDREVCGTAPQSHRVVAVFRGPKGCGQAVSFESSSGKYQYTRDALSSPDVEVFAGSNKVGLVSPARVELWRSDLVRTVEVGKQEAPAQPHLQEHTDCEFTSAMVRTDMLATAQRCPGEDKKLVRLLKATPDSSDKPETIHEFTVPDGSELVAIGKDRAAIYVPDQHPRLQVLEKSGAFQEFPMPAAPTMERPASTDTPGLQQPQTQDLPHAMTWWDGARLQAFRPSTLEPMFAVEGALGTGDTMGDQLLVPVREGIAVVNPTDGHVERTIPVPREQHSAEATEPITLRVLGDTIIEKRGDHVTALRG